MTSPTPSPPKRHWTRGIRWRAMSPADALWLARFLARSIREAAVGVRPFLTLPREPFSDLVPRPLPRKIWLFWSQGWDSAPELVRLCRRSWELRNPGWEVIALDQRTADELTGASRLFEGKDHEVQAMSNAIRLALVARHGGVWADATSFCLKPLDSWLPTLMQSGFFAFARPWRELLCSSWFLAAEPENPLVTLWEAEYRRYWRLMTTLHRYWTVHYVFTDIVRRRPEAAAVWARTPQLAAGMCEQVTRRWCEHDMSDEFDRSRALGVPVLKLDWRLQLHERAAVTLAGDLERR